jgi:hypothetical protein
MFSAVAREVLGSSEGENVSGAKLEDAAESLQLFTEGLKLGISGIENESVRRGWTLSRRGDGKVLKVPVSGEKVTNGSSGICIFSGGSTGSGLTTGSGPGTGSD